MLQQAKEYTKFARLNGYQPNQLAIAWAMRNPLVSSVIIGASSVEQLNDNLKALELKLTDEVVAEIDKIFPL
jgi:aryl-alcohol dehydrogenase-like predicted oxidoreductase